MPRSALRQAQVDRAAPRRKPYSLRDPELRGFGVRIAPSGRKRFFLHIQHDGVRTWRDCGDAATVPADRRAHACGHRAHRTPRWLRRGLPAIRSRRRRSLPAPRTPLEAPHARRQPGLSAESTFCRGSGACSIADHRPEGDVRAWFASLRAHVPTSADRALPVLSVILHQAEVYGYRLRRQQPLSRDPTLPAARAGTLPRPRGAPPAGCCPGSATPAAGRSPQRPSA